MRAQAVEIGLGAGCTQAVPVRRLPTLLRRGAHGVHARQHEHLVRWPHALHERGGEAERVTNDDGRRRQEAPPPAREAGADPHTRSATDGAERRRLREQGIADLAGGRNDAPGPDLDHDEQRLSFLHPRRGHHAADLQAARSGAHPDDGDHGEADQRHSGHVERLGVEQTGEQDQRSAERSRPERSAPAPEHARLTAPASRPARRR